MTFRSASPKKGRRMNRTRNYGLAGGWLTPPRDWTVAVLEEIRALPERKDRD